MREKTSLESKSGPGKRGKSKRKEHPDEAGEATVMSPERWPWDPTSQADIRLDASQLETCVSSHEESTCRALRAVLHTFSGILQLTDHISSLRQFC